MSWLIMLAVNVRNKIIGRSMLGAKQMLLPVQERDD